MTAIIVLGGHRSGTSAVAGVLYHLGVFMGDELIGQNIDNPKGHFEDVEFVKLNKMAVGDWRRPLADLEPVKLAYIRLIRKRERKHKLWGMKDPRVCFLLPYILPLFDQPVKMIHVVRPVRASAASLIKRAEHPKAKSPIRIGARQAMRLARASRDAATLALKVYHGPVLVVYYDRLVSNPKYVVDEIADFVGVKANIKAYNFVDPSLRHHGI